MESTWPKHFQTSVSPAAKLDPAPPVMANERCLVPHAVEYEMAESRQDNVSSEPLSLPLRFVAMTEHAAHDIAAWTFPPPYTLYNHPPERRPTVAVALLNPANQFSAISDGAGDLVGFCCLGSSAQVKGGCYDRPAVDIGMALRPDLTGQGHGRDVVAAVLAYAIGQHPEATVRVTIAVFNGRARRVWSLAGFQQESTFIRATDAMAFLVMTC